MIWALRRMSVHAANISFSKIVQKGAIHSVWVEKILCNVFNMKLTFMPNYNWKDLLLTYLVIRQNIGIEIENQFLG